jgi:HipA-like protein
LTEARVDRGVIKQTANSPHRISCADGLTYVVKPHKSDKQFANELIGLAVGEALGVPLPNAALVTLTSQFIQSSPAIAAKYAPGVHFGSELETRFHWTFDNPAPGIVVSNVSNGDALYSVVLFDEVVVNTDRRNNSGNNMIVRVVDQPPEYEYRAIDHGHILTGPQWTSESLSEFPCQPLVPIFAFMQPLISSLAKLTQVATDVAGMSASFQDIVNRVPTELAAPDISAVVNLLKNRASKLSTWVAGTEYAALLTNLKP